MTDRSGGARPRLPRLAIVADGLATLFIMAGIAVGLTDGFDLAVGRLHLAMHAAWRPFFWAAIVLALRNWRIPNPPSFSWLVPSGAVQWVMDRSAAPLPLEEVALFGGGRSPQKRATEFVLLLLFFAALVVALTWPQALHMADALPDRGDPLFSIWRIAWVAHQIVRDPIHLFDGNIFYPERLTLTYSDSLLLPALISAPFFWLGLPPVLIYNVMLLGAFAASGMATFYFVRALTGRTDAALVSGVVFAFYPYRYEHYPHLELQMTMWAPLALWALHRTMARSQMRDGILTGVAFACQALSSMYYGMFLSLYTLVVGGVLWLGHGRPRGALKALAAGACVAVVLTAPMSAAYLANRSMVGSRWLGTVALYSAEGPDFLKPHFRSAWYGRWAEGGHPERQLFPRIAPVALAATGFLPPLSVSRIGYLLGLVLTVDGSLGLNGAIYPPLYYFGSPFRGLRVPARFSIFTGMTLAILAGLGLARWLARSRFPCTIAAVLIAATAIEAIPHMTFEEVWRQPPHIYDSLDRLSPPAVVAEFPMPTDPVSYPIDARYIYFSTFHWYRLVNGNSGHFPASYEELTKREADFPSVAAIQYLKQRGVQYFTVHGAFMDRDRYQSIVMELAARGDVQLVASAPWEGSESRLYRLTQ